MENKYIVYIALGLSIIILLIMVIMGPPQKELDGCDLDYSMCDTETICDSVSDEAYTLGGVRGCDVGCIDYDLRVHNKTWKTTEEEYDLLASEDYQACSSFCVGRQD